MTSVQLIRPDADDVDGRWTDNTGGTTLFDKIDEVWAENTPSIDLGFADSAYYDGSAYGADVTTLLSCSRASSGYAQTKAGTLTSFGSNTLRITDLGLLSEDARTNIILQSADLTASPWIVGGSVTATANSTDVTDPAGGTASTKLVSTAAADNYVTQQNNAHGGTGVTITISFWARKTSGTLSLAFGLDDTAGNVYIGADISTNRAAVTSSWQRFTATGTGQGGIGAPIRILFGGFSQWATADTIYIWGVQAEVAGFVSSYIPTTSAEVTRAADVITATGALNTILIGNAGSVVVDVQTDYASASINQANYGVYIFADEANSISFLSIDFNFPDHMADMRFPGTFQSNTFGNSKTLLTGVKIGSCWTTAGTASIVGGGGTVANATTTVTAMSAPVTILNGGFIAPHYFGLLRRFTAWNSKLADATLQALTDPIAPYGTDYIKSSPVTAGDVDMARVRLSDPSGGVTAPAKVRFNYKKTGNDKMALTVALMEGSTEIAHWDKFDVGTDFITSTETLTTPQFNAISDFTNLYLKFLSEYQWWLDGAAVDLNFMDGRYYDSSVILGGDPAHMLLHFDGADTSTTIVDATNRHLAVVAGGAQIKTNQSKFGGSSCFFNGGADSVRCFGPNDFTIGTADFTMDGWFRWSDVTGQQNFWAVNSPAAAFAPLIMKTSGNVLAAYTSGFGQVITGTTTIATNTWYHIALTRSATGLRLFLNGTQEGSTYTANIENFSGVDILIGEIIGWAEEVRFLKGVALWTANFTPASAAYDPNVTGPYGFLSCSRASTGYAKTNAGVLTNFSANTLRITDLGLLVEDARTNLLTNSQAFQNWLANWSATASADQTTAPDGTSTADKIISGIPSDAQYIRANNVSTSNNTYTFSCYLKAAEYGTAALFLGDGDTGSIAAKFTLSGAGTVVQYTHATFVTGNWTGFVASIEQMANGWYRCRMTGTSAAGSPTIQPFVSLMNPEYIFVGDGTSGIYAWGAQVEVGSFPSSYIPTTSVSVTRARDEITTIGNFTTVANSATASAFAAIGIVPFNPTANPEGDAGVLARNSFGQAVLRLDGYSAGSDRHIEMQDGTLNLVALAPVGTGYFTVSEFKMASSWDGSGKSICGQGGTVATDAGVMGSATGDLNLRQTYSINAYHHRLAVWNTRLADVTLQGLTNP